MIAEVLSDKKQETGFFVKKVSDEKIKIVASKKEATLFESDKEVKELARTAAPDLKYRMKKNN